MAPQARATRRNYMSIHLATALTADAPLIGLKSTKLLERSRQWARRRHRCASDIGPVGIPSTEERATPSSLLVGKAMLTANLLPTFYPREEE